MNLIVKIIIAVAVAAAATAITTFATGTGHATLVLFIAFCGATVATALLVSLPGGSRASTAPRKSRKKPHADKPAQVDSSHNGPREHGTVKWFNVSKGFGFITKDDGEEIFVHFRSIRGGGGRRGLRDGQSVTFVCVDSDKGPQAEDVEGLD